MTKNIPLKSDSAYSERQVVEFLVETAIPLRLACHGHKGYPLVASHWFLYEEGYLCCAVHDSSLVAQLLTDNPKCGFEVAPDTIPYHGVRGQGEVTLSREGAGEMLGRLILRYLGNLDSSLAKWLMSRADGEYLVRIRPTWLTAWDFSERMQS
jgi:hypothetical protein